MSATRLVTVGKFGFLDVTDLTPEERVALLAECDREGWDILIRGVLDPKGAVTGENLAEYWYFRRRERGPVFPGGPA